MSSAPKRIRQLAINGTALGRDTICRTCLIRISRQSRQFAAAAAVAPAAEEPAGQNGQSAQNKGLQKAYRLLIAPVVSRPPMLTRESTSFEKAYYLYQKRLNERLALPLTRYFYYKKGTPADVEWKRKIKSRQTAARDIGVYNAYGEFGWNDEVLLGDKTAEPDATRDALIRDAEGRDIVNAKPVDDKDVAGAVIAGDAAQGEATQKELQLQLERPASRVAKADNDNDTKSLSRKMDRILYLLVKNAEGRWRFPEDRMLGAESLYQAAERIIVQSAGINMNTWVVGNHPIGHFQYNYPSPKTTKFQRQRTPESPAEEVEQEEQGEKVFFMKARILAGQADLAKNIYGDSEYQWLAKEEIESQVTPQYWSYIRNMLTER
ncbi:hypothetical protein AMS68_006615 [Peltaster fructicola]|uniref:Large ribosomal subunit protein mL46 n=1 Tax=Peltaster fructicola TaxID=286661 RepID=A0A6H0Y2M1_9PEZI|nr:hypothetical protein AMS68_006615 [Peltaster fructicola]